MSNELDNLIECARAWAKCEAQGFQYGKDALENVRFGTWRVT